MTELWLIYKDETGAEKKIPVESEKFAVGRHSANDLSIVDGRLSREHLSIERFGDIFIVSDLGSSNGTTLGGAKLEKPEALKNGDALNLGGLEIKVEIVSDEDSGNASGGAGGSAASPEANDKSESAAAAQAPPNQASQSVSASAGSGSIPTSFFYLAPLFGFLILAVIGVSVYLFGSSGKPDRTAKDDDFIYTSTPDDSLPENADEDNSASNEKPTPAPTANSAADNSALANNTSSAPDNSAAAPAKPLSETAKIEQNSASFLRRIAQNDPKAFLTSEQAQIVGGKIKQMSGSPVLAENIKSARANAAQIAALANSKNLRPQFLACVAIARLGSQRGNVLQTAQAMTENLDKLLIHVGGERADDVLLMVAAYDQGARGEVLQFRNMLQQLPNQFPESSRTIRTIWFLREKGKISEAEFELALRFLAIGTITQNPKEFGVNAEELKL